MKRSDQSLAIYGVLLLAVVGLVGYIVLIALGKEAPDVLLTGVVGVALGGVLGWARGGTYYEPDSEKVPAAPVQSHVDVPIIARADDYAYRDDPSQRA